MTNLVLRTDAQLTLTRSLMPTSLVVVFGGLEL